MIDTMDYSAAIHHAMTGSRELDTAVPRMEEEEFRAFYERTARPLWSYLSRISGDRQKADDLLQETYYRFYRAGARHENEAHRRNSLFQIATNLVRDAGRRTRHYEEVPLEAEESQAGPATAGPAMTPEREVSARMDLSRAMEQLDQTQRELLWLAYAQGISHDEIAAILGVRSISVRTLLFRARKKLAALLTGEAGGVQKEGR